MATVRRRAVLGRHPPSAGLRRSQTLRSDHLSSMLKTDTWTANAKPEEFIYYSDSSDEEAGDVGDRRCFDTTSRSFVDYHVDRQTGLQRFSRMSLSKDHATKHLLSYSMLRERNIPVGGYNKVFCSAWLSDNQVVFGTKCNKVLVYNLRTRRIDSIPMLLSRTPSTVPADHMT